MYTANMRKTTSTTLPRRLPRGTRYVIEGRRSKSGNLRIVSRQVIFPSGEYLDVAAPAAERPQTVRRKSDRRRRA